MKSSKEVESECSGERKHSSSKNPVFLSELEYSDTSESTLYQRIELSDAESDLSEIPVGSDQNLSIIRNNIKTIVQGSTALPFRWLVTAYRCFFCYELFYHQDELKSHQILHDDMDIDSVITKFCESTVYIDVSVLNCKLCSGTFQSMEDLIDHLIHHGFEYNKGVETFIPFNLAPDKVSCVFCEEIFSDFTSLLSHSDEHNPQGCLCYICGKTYKKHQIKMHLANEHRSKLVKCTKCEETFSVHTIRTHMTRVHNRLYKCKMCSATFETVYKRAAHLTTVHRGREYVKCPECPNTYYFASTMRRHVKQVHNKERHVQCQLCGWRGYKGYQLKQHVLKKHSGLADQDSVIKA